MWTVASDVRDRRWFGEIKMCFVGTNGCGIVAAATVLLILLALSRRVLEWKANLRLFVECQEVDIGNVVRIVCVMPSSSCLLVQPYNFGRE